jgi:hypothetical protein
VIATQQQATSINRERGNNMQKKGYIPADPSSLIQAVGLFQDALRDMTGDDTMPMQQSYLLLVLYMHRDGVAQAKLSDFTKVADSANSRNVQKLGVGVWSATGTLRGKAFKPGLGLVENIADPQDQRTKYVRLTDKGRGVMDECARRVLVYYT